VARCPICREGKLVKGKAPAQVHVGKHLFTAELPAMCCDKCDEVYFDGSDLRRFESQAAAELAKAGESSAEALVFQRKTLGLMAKELAELLDIRPEHLSKWENGKLPVERRAAALVAAMVLEHVQGRSSTLECLRALRRPITLGHSIRLRLA
jgi:putative zinc finger/helix-turn-helix YgiT family protein